MSGVFRATEAFMIGMHATALLARNTRSCVRAGNIAKECKVSEAHLAKVFQRLARSGIVRGERGPAGGFALSRSAAEISLMDIWIALEGKPETGACPFLIPACKGRSCSLGLAFIDVCDRMEALMKRTTLRDLEDMIPHARGDN